MTKEQFIKEVEKEQGHSEGSCEPYAGEMKQQPMM